MGYEVCVIEMFEIDFVEVDIDFISIFFEDLFYGFLLGNLDMCFFFYCSWVKIVVCVVWWWFVDFLVL